MKTRSEYEILVNHLILDMNCSLGEIYNESSSTDDYSSYQRSFIQNEHEAKFLIWGLTK